MVDKLTSLHHLCETTLHHFILTYNVHNINLTKIKNLYNKRPVVNKKTLAMTYIESNKRRNFFVCNFLQL